MEEEKQEVKGTVWLWTVIGAIVGWFLFGFIAGLLGLVDAAAYVVGAIGVVVIGFLAHRSSAKNGGSAPSWLCRSKKK